ncbi:glycoside hydrolase family 127 protein [Pseudothermotoga elfii]
MDNKQVIKTEKSPYSVMKGVDLSAVVMKGFLGRYFDRAADVTLPKMYETLEKTGRIDNFRFASNRKEGSFQGFRFNDTDAYKWIEAVSFLFASRINPDLEEKVDLVIDEIIAAQDEDGYLDSYYPKSRKHERWTELSWSHEMYCAGHLLQGAIAHRRITGKETLFKAAQRFADLIEKLFGPGKKPELDGHPEIEMALVELYRETADRRYLDLADYFIRARGKGNASSKKYPGITPEYFVDHKPFVELEEMVGHAVRMLYLCCGVTDLYLETGREDLFTTLERLWQNLVEKKMHITGGCGSRSEWEAFGENYELPNKRAYTETCAAIANFMWNYRMLFATADGKYADVMEQTLYNGLLSGISTDGWHYFYDNPLESDGTHRRREWFECACCPPNIARLITSLPGYLYSLSKDETRLWINLYEASEINLDTSHGTMKLLQETEYPWSGDIRLTVLESNIEQSLSFYLRIPGWVRDFSLMINGEPVDVKIEKGYVEIRKKWKNKDQIELKFVMPVELIQSHPYVEENRGRVAIKRGPVVYCAEGVDNDFDVRALSLSYKSMSVDFEQVGGLGKIPVITGNGHVEELSAWKGKLYLPVSTQNSRTKPVNYKLIPYHLWANREATPMVVWIKFSQD